MNNILTVLFGLGACVSAYLLIKTIFDAFFSVSDESLHKKRLKQLQFNKKRTSLTEDKAKVFIDKFTNPVATKIIPKLNINDDSLTQLEKDLEMGQWNKFFTPLTFNAMNVTLKILAVFVFLIFMQKSLIFALILLVIIGFGFKFLFNNSIKQRKFKLLCEFPELIRTIQGYLMSNIPLPKAIENSLPYVGDEWRPILREFVINSEVYSQSECIDMLSNKVDIFEVRELWSLIKLNSEQGIDIKECFTNQAEKVRTLQLEVMMDKIEKRHMLSVAVQGPLLLDMIVIFGLPTFVQMMTSL